MSRRSEATVTSAITEYEWEPVRGLPGHLPAGEVLLWQGAPSWWALACHALHLRAVAGYFAVLLTWRAAAGWSGSPTELGASMLPLFGLTAGALALTAAFAWLTAKTTVYSVTNRRVVLRYGMALPKAVNVPFALVLGAGLRTNPGGTGDIPLSLERAGKLPYPLMWPHVRPWRISRAQPMLRAIPDAALVAQRLSRALAAATGGEAVLASVEPARAHLDGAGAVA